MRPTGSNTFEMYCICPVRMKNCIVELPDLTHNNLTITLSSLWLLVRNNLQTEPSVLLSFMHVCMCVRASVLCLQRDGLERMGHTVSVWGENNLEGRNY